MSDPRDERELQPFVFHDPHGKRWPRFRIGLLVLGIFIFAALVWFAESLFVKPQLRLPAKVRTIKGQLKALQKIAPPAAATKPDTWQKYYPTSQASLERLAKLRAQLHPKPRKFDEIRLGFYVNWDANAYDSLEKHADKLTHICPEEWMTVIDGYGNLRVEEDAQLEHLALARGLVLMPMLNNLVENTWQPEAVEGLVNGPADRRDKFIVNLLSHLDDAKAGGVVIDWEQVDPTYQPKITDFLQKISAALHAVNKQLWLVVPMGEEITTYDIETLSTSVDRFVAVLYDENSESDEPGPIASQNWLEGWLEVIQGYGNPDQWIGVLGAFGYDWTAGAKTAETITFQDAMSRASYAGIDKLEIKEPSYNAQFSYQEAGDEHTVWFLDAVSFFNQLRVVRDGELGGIGIARLGTEDPQIWDVMSMPSISEPEKTSLKFLEKIKSTETVTNIGQGEVVTVDDTQDDGDRTLQLLPNEMVAAVYTDFPTYPILYHQGAGEEHQVVLTFDDGPDPKWTPQVLDILKARNVKAVFFLIGRQAEDYPKLVRRIVDEGHEIGSHTYTHPNLSLVSHEQISLELNATQFLLESITGRSTTLFRPPYNADSRPSSLAELAPLKIAQEEFGYLLVMESIDPEDWARPGTEEIIQRIKDQRHLGNIILLHDAGGNRAQTVEALPKIIDYLEARGDRIVPLNELLNIHPPLGKGDPRDELMPPLTRSEMPWTRLITGFGFNVWRTLEQFLWAFMIAATALIVLRTAIVAVLASKHHRKIYSPDEAPYHPPISVIIAAYNEAKVIQATLRSVADTDYPGVVEIIVIDDGSKDDTSEEVKKFVFVDRRIRLIQQPNRGKSEALSNGMANSKYDILVFLDADTHFERSTLTQLVQPFIDPKIGAVSGHAKVGNLRTFIARCQSLEYICGFNLDRRAYAEWNCITVAPGAVSALRRSAIEEAGGFSTDTLAEDTDLTLSLHKKGYRIDYAPHAVAWTEAPESYRTLAKQRFRWAFGTLQCLWKHRDLVFNPHFKALGWFSLPSVWFFQIILIAFTPVVDLLLIVSLIESGASNLWIYFFTFMLMDVILAMMACWMDDEKIRKAWIILPMRIIYRPLLSWVIWRAIIKAIKGAWVTWGKLERTASVTAQPGK
jgi:cellulose synthase/poly-beta-1,6-N-acetylglucosamine synthase-like glycosyltransferase/peptidoglycan/xylan/chitin deacetylase (PgdA/CDA1 family)/spore germination protein YaaH